MKQDLHVNLENQVSPGFVQVSLCFKLATAHHHEIRLALQHQKHCRHPCLKPEITCCARTGAAEVSASSEVRVK